MLPCRSIGMIRIKYPQLPVDWSTVMQALLSHATEDALESYALNHFGEHELASLEEHLLVCENCRVVLTGLDEEIQVMRLALNQN